MAIKHLNIFNYFCAHLIVVCTLTSMIDCIVIGRIDSNKEYVVFVNGQPLSPGSAFNSPAYQQLFNVILKNGQVIPASVRFEFLSFLRLFLKKFIFETDMNE